MTDENTTSSFIKTIAEQIPVKDIYNDGLSPAVKQTGSIGSDIIKTLHLALFPLQFTAAIQDRLRNFIDTSVRSVPEDKRVTPPSQILGPVIEGIRYEPEGTPIDTMFSELLSCSMSRDHISLAHPAYPLIIKQLSADEAKILHSLLKKNFDFIYTQDLFDQRVVVIEVDDLPRENLSFPENVSFYMDHLHQLGLAGTFQVGNQAPLHRKDPRTQDGVRVHRQYRLTHFGHQFMQACTPKGLS